MAAICTLALLCGTLAGCSDPFFNGMAARGTAALPVDSLCPPTAMAGNVASYSLGLDIKGNYLQGMLSVQADSTGENVRIVCAAVFGFTVFDVELQKEQMLIYQCDKMLRHKSVLRLLEKDLRLLFYRRPMTPTGQLGARRFVSTNKPGEGDTTAAAVGYLVPGSYKTSYKFDSLGRMVGVQTSGGMSRGNVVYAYQGTQEVPCQITLTNPLIKLQAKLTPIAAEDEEEEKEEQGSAGAANANTAETESEGTGAAAPASPASPTTEAGEP